MTDDTTAREVLREVQWVHDGDFGASFCPICCAKKPTHKEDCRLAAALRDPVFSQAAAIQNEALEEVASSFEECDLDGRPWWRDGEKIARAIRAFKSTPADQNAAPTGREGAADAL